MKKKRIVRLEQPQRIIDIEPEGRPRISGGATLITNCRKCGVANCAGFSVNSVKDVPTDGAYQADLTVSLDCKACGYAMERCQVRVQVMGLGSWSVIKGMIQ